jgi:hypothetical protein
VLLAAHSLHRLGTQGVFRSHWKRWVSAPLLLAAGALLSYAALQMLYSART